jgi:GDP/UDP-N,N'-diacetylbacillosamine 2-epimerase (hydrolysing)
MKKKICVVTGSRAEYGVLRHTLNKINKSENLQLSLVVTGMHLSQEFGYTINEIIKDGFNVDAKVEMLMSSNTNVGVGKSIGLGIISMVDRLETIDPDMVLIVGDRYEIFAVAAATMALNIPLAHISGGEITEGAIDEQIRHAITKMSHIHFVAIDENAQRVRQMGEETWRVHTVGGPWVDNINYLEKINSEELKKKLNVTFSRPIILVTYHSTTLQLKDTNDFISNLLGALKQIEADIIFTYPNADAGGRIIIDAIESFVKNHSNARLFKSMGGRLYLNTLSQIDLLVGNSSSGMVETQAFKLPVVNIGDRQKGRMITKNIICSPEKEDDILKAVEKGLSKTFRNSLENMENPYDKGGVADNIVNILSEVKFGMELMHKKFITNDMSRNK